MKPIENILSNKNLLTIYFTAGFPKLEDTAEIIKALNQAGVDLIEVGLPFSDSLVDGPTIQASNEVALANGMSLKKLLEQLKAVESEAPLILMGSINPILQYGIENFAADAEKSGISALILPDLPPEEYKENYEELFQKHNLKTCFLVSPHTSDERIKYIDSLTTGFIYAVSSDATTGDKLSLAEQQINYYQRLNSLNLSNPHLIGFGIRDHESFVEVCKYASGGIIGSGFIRAIEISKTEELQESIRKYISSIRKED